MEDVLSHCLYQIILCPNFFTCVLPILSMSASPDTYFLIAHMLFVLYFVPSGISQVGCYVSVLFQLGPLGRTELSLSDEWWCSV